MAGFGGWTIYKWAIYIFHGYVELHEEFLEILAF